MIDKFYFLCFNFSIFPNLEKYFEVKMKKYSILFLLIIVLSSSINFSQTMNSRDLVVPLWVEISKTPNPSIKLKWERSGYVETYAIFKRTLDNLTFGSAIATLDSLASEWTDFNVKLNETYEYQVLGLGKKYVKENDTLFAYRIFAATGYTLAGIEAIPKFFRGTALLLVDETLREGLNDDLIVLQSDLEAEGYNVVIKNAPRAEKFDKNKVIATKQIINEQIAINPDLSTIILIGRIPVPYSGDFNPDAHPDHRGAWPADVYYATSDNLWTDQSVDNKGASREENRNVPGDGKFDLITLPSYYTVPIAVGRIDMYGMKLFYDTTKANPELELIKKYLRRNHKYRIGEIEPERRALIDDNFSAQSYPEAFAASGWRSFLNFFPSNLVKAEDYISILSTKSYLWSYGCGGGSYTSCGGIGNTSDFANKGMNGIFTFLFGSYFGDWDIENNFLRAPLAAKEGALTIGWSGRPHWFVHHMNLGEPIGTSLLAIQNNNNIYLPNIYYTAQFPNGVLYTTGTRQVHIALLGDPTLKMFNKRIPEPKNLQIVEQPNGYLKLKWEAPQGLADPKFLVYRNTEKNPKLVLVTSLPISDTEFEDKFLFDGVVNYKVVAIGLDSSRSGSFYVPSRPASGSIKTVDVKESTNLLVSVFPNPATDHLKIYLNSNENVSKILITDILGNPVKIFDYSLLPVNQVSLTWDLLDNYNQKIENGVYIIKIELKTQTIIQKVVVNK